MYFDAIYVNSSVDVVLVKKCIPNFATYHMYVQLKKIMKSSNSKMFSS